MALTVSAACSPSTETFYLEMNDDMSPATSQEKRVSSAYNEHSEWRTIWWMPLIFISITVVAQAHNPGGPLSAPKTLGKMSVHCHPRNSVP